MTRAITIAAREMRERSFVFITAAIAALIPFVAAILRVGNSGALPIIAVVGFSMSLTFTFGLAGVLGASMVGRELSERRLSFYFSKPVSASAIWFGKLSGALVTIAVCFGLIFLPSYLVARPIWGQTFGQITPGGFVAFVLTVSVYLLLLLHALSSMVRSRSALVALDLVLLALFAGALWLIIRPLVANVAFDLVMKILRVAVLAIPVAIAAAGAWQLSRGRTDIRRSHLELSRFFWIAVAVVIAGAGAFVVWVLSATPADLRNVNVAANNGADWMVMTGTAANRGDYRPAFLVDTRTGKAKRFPAMRWQMPEFTRRGDAAISIVPSGESLHRGGRGRVHVQRLATPDATSDTGIEASLFSRVVLSDDLRRMAVSDAHVLSVYDAQSHALLASARIPVGDEVAMFFVSPSVIRVYPLKVFKVNAPAPSGELPIYEFDIARRRLTETGQLMTSPGYQVLVSRDGSTAVVNRDQIVIADGRTGSTRAVINAGGRSRWLALLSTGGVAFIQPARLCIFDRNGKLVREIPLANFASGGNFGARVRELVPGKKLLLTVSHKYVPNPALGADLAIVDLERGVVESVQRDVALREQFRSADPRVPDVTAEYVISDANGTVWRWNAVTGEKHRIFG